MLMGRNVLHKKEKNEASEKGEGEAPFDPVVPGLALPSVLTKLQD